MNNNKLSVGNRMRFAKRTVQVATSWKSGKIHLSYFPKMVAIEPTNRCNFKCEFCPQSSATHFVKCPKGDIKLEQVEWILKLMRREGAWSRTISFTQDGEPFVHRQFEEMVRLANDHGFRPRFSSNCSLTTPERAEKLCKSGYFKIAVDFSADEKFFETSRGFKSTWAKTLEHLRYLVRLTKDYPLANIQITDITNWKYDDKRTHPEDIEALKNLFSDIDYVEKQVYFNARVFHNFIGHLSMDKIGKKAGMEYNLCTYPWISFRIRWNGDCVICCRDTESDTVLGNVFEEGSILKIWHGPAYENARKLLVDKKPEALAACAVCDLPWAQQDKRWELPYLVKSYLSR